MPLKLKEVGTPVVYGLVDLGTEYIDAQAAKSNPNVTQPFRNVTDIQRALVTVGGFALNYSKSDKMRDLGTTLFTASIPLLEKSIVKLAMSFQKTQGYGGRLVLRSAGTDDVYVPPRITGAPVF